MYGMVLCAGLGTRLRPLTLERPKPIVPVLGRPLAAWAMEHLARAGVRALVANTHHLAQQVGPALAPWAQRHRAAWHTVHEPVLLGTGGAIRNALPHLGQDPFYVFNGDVLAFPDLARAMALHQEVDARMTMVLRDVPDAGRFGVIEVDETGRVRRMLDEGPSPGVPVRRCMFTGIYVLSADVRDDLPGAGCIVRHALRRWLARGDTVAAVVDPNPWFDLGTIEAYVGVQFDVLAGRTVLPGVPTPFEGRLVAATAAVGGGVQVGPEVVVGDGARCVGHGALRRCIAWDGALVEAPAAGVVVTAGHGRVPVPGIKN